jgi:hypothetical protein
MKKLLNLAVATALSGLAMANEAVAKVKFCDKDYDLDTKEVFFKFGNGTELKLETSRVPEETRIQLMLHGASQKVGDSFAGVKGNFAEGIGNAQDVIDQLYAGVWKADREGDARPRLAELAEAIARIKQVPIESATAAVEKGTDDQRKTWRSNAKVKAVIAQIRAEKAAKALEDAEKAGAQTLEVAGL